MEQKRNENDEPERELSSTEHTETNDSARIGSEQRESDELVTEEPVSEAQDTQETSQHGPSADRSRSGLGWKLSTAVLAVLLAGSLIWQTTADREQPVALVNGIAIDERALYDELVKINGAAVLDGMIAQESIRQGIAKAGVTTNEAEVDAEFDVMVENYGSEEALLAALEQYGYTESSFREQMTMQLQIEKIIADDVTVTDEEIADYFEANKVMLDQPEQVRASHILVETKEEAEALLAKLQGGEDFAVLASAHSMDASNKDSGGDLNYFGRGWMEEGFETAAFALAVGERGIAETNYGYHVIEVTDKLEAVEATLEGSKADIRKQLEEQQMMELANAWIAKQQSSAKVENKLKPTEEPQSVQ